MLSPAVPSSPTATCRAATRAKGTSTPTRYLSIRPAVTTTSGRARPASTGANNALPADSLDLDEDGDTAERLPLDLDGNPRFADDADTEDTGCGAPVVVDMGAYEFQGDAWHPMLIGDIDGNGAVNTTDLLVLLAAWGEYEDDCVLADLDFSGEVNTADLLTLLANWG